MFTSCFANLERVAVPLSISGRAPSGYAGPQFKVLAPKLGFYTDYKDGRIDAAGYTAAFHAQVLAPLDPRQIYDRLTRTYGADVTLLCYEPPGAFCHRRLVAAWLEAALGVTVPELAP